MRAVVIHETGGPEVLRFEEVPQPEPGDGEVLVRVRVIGVNPIEWKLRRGMKAKSLPAILGSDVSGTVERSRAASLSEGDEVFGFAASGAYAEYATSPAEGLAKRPAGLADEQAAALPVAALTAWQALFDHGGLEAGQRVLIAGASGGVGHLAIQFAKRAGAHAIGIGSGANREFVLSLGADEFVDYREQDVASAVGDVDLAFDTVGGETTLAMLATVRDGGALVTIANDAPTEQAKQRGIDAQHAVMNRNAEQLAEIGGLVASGEVRVEIAQTLPFDEVRRAHELSEAGHTRGKILLRV
jgi:NADPH:quinone reductase-like Zn-dependent oxidoreductase